MRLLASLPDEDQASRLGDYLLTLGIDNSVEEGPSGWSVWVKDDDKVEPAKKELAQFQINPADPRYSSAARTAEKVRAEQEKRAKRLEKNYVDVRTQWSKAAGGFSAVTLAIIAMSCLVQLIVYAGRDRVSIDGLQITAREPPALVPVARQAGPIFVAYWPPSGLLEIKHGQLWRLITPIFVHYGLLHLLFNMSGMRYLGSMIEQRKGSLFMALMVLLVALPSNIAQYMMGGPWFGGMSGVVFGLFGYVWMKGKFSPAEGMGVPRNTVIYGIVWFLICFTGWIGPIANAAHAVGLLMGMAMGSAGYLRRRLFS